MRRIIFFLTLNTLSILSLEIYSQNIFNDKKTNEVVKVDEFTKKTKGCETYNGLFNIYQNKKDGKAYIEIDTSHLDKEFIYQRWNRQIFINLKGFVQKFHFLQTRKFSKISCKTF